MLVKKVLILDEIDKTIVKTLLENPRSTMTAIGDICNMSDVSVKKRINKLENHNILEFKVILADNVDLDNENTIVQVIESSESASSDNIHEISENDD